MDSSKHIALPVTLNGMNYLLWARTTRTNMCGHGLWNHIEAQVKETFTNGERKIISGDSSSKEGKWFQEDQGVLGLLQNSLETAILEAYSYCETAKELWETLKNVYGNVSNLTRVFEVKKSINSLSQEDLEFMKHFGKFRSLWAELEMLRPFSVDPAILKERSEQDKVFGLLLTLNHAFNDLIKHILRAEKLPSLEEVCSQVQREQGSVGLFSGKGEIMMAHKVTFKPEDRKILVCDHCKKRGHTKDKCWVLHPHLKPLKFKGHESSKFKGQVNSSQEASTEQAQVGPSRQGDELAMVAYSNDVVRKSDLEALIKSLTLFHNKESGITHLASLPNLQSKTLIVDSGASHHMISNHNLINNVKPASGNVIIANGDRIPIRGIGDLRLCDKNSKAFFMPEFTSNLVSVKKATTDLNCYAIFGPNSFHFQDIESGKVLGEGNTNGDLYVFEDSPAAKSTPLSCQSCYAVSPNKLWHDRLGHPHARALEIILPHVVFDHLNCEACILGKHCKTVFPKSATI
ncbi:Retrovirus-related Pol polyprotein from transposon RE1 [Cardamine amara subsp. amara]|uniref:Retrovirus-related Pol polyprotein from transposon RE1 n=1 Tax=Cardamine amara subsp. amara TaxID=228776 RepID=A0ABD1B0B2_CARAN